MTLLSALSIFLAVASPIPPNFERQDELAVDGQVVVAPKPATLQRLAILPDRTTGRDWGLRYLRQAVADLNRLAPDAVFTIGDMIQGYTRDAIEWKRQTDEYFGIVGDLSMPLFPVAGNHDVIGGTRRSGDDTFIDHYRRHFGPLWYSVELDRATMLVMFSDEAMGDGALRISDEQLAWLDGALTKAKARGVPSIVLMHRPLWRSASVRWEERVQPRLEKAGVVAVIAGHFHSMQRDRTIGGIEYHIVGVCGGAIDQHPYAGQMQHLSFLDILEDGSISFYHAAVGLTLPKDFVDRLDQDRVHALRNRPGVLEWKGSFPDPLTTSTPAVGEVVLEFHNPLDVPVEVSFEQLRSEPRPWIIGRENFVSWTPVDTFNPATMQLAGPFNISALDKHPVQPGDTTQLPVRLRSIPVSEAVQPPPIEFRIEMLDRLGRTIPVTIPLRLPLQRVVELPGRIEDAPPFPICVWTPSPFDTLDENPTCRLALERGERGDTLLVEVRVHDSKPTAFKDDDRPFEQRRDDPIGDAVRVIIAMPERTIETLTEPFAGRSFGDPCEAEAPEEWPDRMGWTQRIRVPWPGGRFDPSMPSTINVGIADNDDTYHTQWRWLAPRSTPARATLPVTAPQRSR